MIGQVVEFITDKNTKSFGIVVDKINMIHEGSVITGYMVKNTLGKTSSITYWKITKILESEEEKTQEIESQPHPLLQNDQTYPKTKKSILKEKEDKQWIQDIIDSPFNTDPQFKDDLPF